MTTRTRETAQKPSDFTFLYICYRKKRYLFQSSLNEDVHLKYQTEMFSAKVISNSHYIYYIMQNLLWYTMCGCYPFRNETAKLITLSIME